MFHIIKNNTGCTIHLTSGDVATIEVTANTKDGNPYVFKFGEVVSFKVFEKNDCSCIVIDKRVLVDEATEVVTIQLESDDTKFGKGINKPVDYWYEIEINPDTYPQTIVGYDMNGPKVFRLYPEGA